MRSDMIDFIEEIDRSLLLWLNSKHTPFFDDLMFFVSGKWEWVPFYLILIVFIILKFKRSSVIILIGAALLITLSDQGSNLLKDSIQRPRPCKDPEIGHLVLLVNDYCRGAYGFVSAHAANSFALAGLISLLFRNRWVTTGMMTWAVIVSYSRIYLGVHYPGDILGGAIMGLLLSRIIYFFIIRLAKPVAQPDAKIS